MGRLEAGGVLRSSIPVEATTNRGCLVMQKAEDTEITEDLVRGRGIGE